MWEKIGMGFTVAVLVVFGILLTLVFLRQSMYYKYKYIAYEGNNKLHVSSCINIEQAKLCKIGEDYELVDNFTRIRIGKSKNKFAGLFYGYERVDTCYVGGDKETCFWIWEEANYEK